MDDPGARGGGPAPTVRTLRAGALCGLGSGAVLGLGLALLAQQHTANPLLDHGERVAMVLGWMLAWAEELPIS